MVLLWTSKEDMEDDVNKLSSYEDNQPDFDYSTDSYQTDNEKEINKSFNWLTVLDRLKEKSNPQVSFWFSSLNFIGRNNNSITLEAKNNFDRDWINNHYMDFIRETVDEIYDGNFDVTLSTNNEEKVENNKENKASAQIKPTRGRLAPISGSLNSNYTFDSFIVGSSNQFAHAASIAAAQKPGEAYNPLFIHGGVGLGKTHLINAIGNYALENSSNKLRVCCISAEHFTNEVINGIKTNKMEEFRNRYRFGCDILLIDDIQFIAGKQSTQEEFFHTFNTLYESKKQIVLTSDKSPNEMSFLEERLRSRFEWGLIADIQPPEIETRIAILTQKAESENVELPSDVAMFIAQHTSSNIRELEGSLNNIVAHSKLLNTEITLEIAKKALKNLVKRQMPKIITIETIQKEVASFFDVKMHDLKSSRKHKNISLPRQIAMFLSRKYTVASFPEIGERFGGKDHSTVIHAVRKIESLLGEDSALTSSVDSISRKLERIISG